MTYLMKRGRLYGDDRQTALAVIRSEITGHRKQVETQGRLYTADVLPGGYRMEDENKQPVLQGTPGYAAGEDPAQFDRRVGSGGAARVRAVDAVRDFSVLFVSGPGKRVCRRVRHWPKRAHFLPPTAGGVVPGENLWYAVCRT